MSNIVNLLSTGMKLPLGRDSTVDVRAVTSPGGCGQQVVDVHAAGGGSGTPVTTRVRSRDNCKRSVPTIAVY